MEYLIIILVCLVVYFRSLKYGVVVDDIANRSNGHEIRKNDSGRILLERIRLRLNGECPIVNIENDHALTLLIHTIVCLLIYKIFNNLPAAILFAVNVSNNQVSLWLNGKRYGINAILCLLAYGFLPFGIVFWVLTGMFQVSAITFPVVMMLSVGWFAFLVFPAALLMWKSNLLLNINVRIDNFIKNGIIEYIKFRPIKVLFCFKTIFYYFLRGILPYIPTMYPEKYKDFGLTDKATNEAYRFDLEALCGFLIVITTLIGYALLPSLFFGMMWWLITVIVFGNIITLTVPIAERYMYLPNIGLMLFLCNILSLIHPMAWTYVALVYSVRLLTFMPMYKNIDLYLKHHTFYYPENDQAWLFRANRHSSNGDVFGVLHLSNEGLLNNQKSWWLWLQRANGFMKIGQKKLALECVSRSKECAKDNNRAIFEKTLDKFVDIKNELK